MRAYLNYTRLVLAFVFLVILAGGIVRTTQSGMGCPDWPHCFGMWVPPLSAKGLPPDYQKYLSRQDIDATYNPVHAWTEYINRLITGALGILILIHVIWSFKKFFRTKSSIAWLSCLLLVGTAFEAWLGKLVVETNLEVIKITGHMLAALFLAIIPIIILYKLNDEIRIHDKTLRLLTTIALIVLLVQIVIGTDVRQQVDVVSKGLQYQQRDLWLNKINLAFLYHKIGSIVTSLFVIIIFWRSLSYPSLQKKGFLLLGIILALMTAGISLATFNIPAFIQPIHLLLSSMLFVALFNLRLYVKK